MKYLLLFFCLLCTQTGFGQNAGIKLDSLSSMLNLDFSQANEEVKRLEDRLTFCEQYANKYFKCKNCYDDEEYYCSYEEIRMNKHCFTPLGMEYMMLDSQIFKNYYLVHPDSIDTYKSVFDHAKGAWVFFDIPE